MEYLSTFLEGFYHVISLLPGESAINPCHSGKLRRTAAPYFFYATLSVLDVYNGLEFIDNNFSIGPVATCEARQAQRVIAVNPRGRGQAQPAFGVRRQGPSLPGRSAILMPDAPKAFGWNLLPINVNGNLIAGSQPHRPEDQPDARSLAQRVEFSCVQAAVILWQIYPFRQMLADAE